MLSYVLIHLTVMNSIKTSLNHCCYVNFCERVQIVEVQFLYDIEVFLTTKQLSKHYLNNRLYYSNYFSGMLLDASIFLLPSLLKEDIGCITAVNEVSKRKHMHIIQIHHLDISVKSYYSNFFIRFVK
jgi:hypothetical protein